MKSYIYIILFVIGFSSCKLDKVENPNAADPNDIRSNPTKEVLQALVSGIEASSRNQHAVYCLSSGIVAREGYLFNSDPRNTGDLLGKDGTIIDNNTFYLTGPFNARYICIKTANILLEVIDNSPDANDDEKNAFKGYGNTMKAHQFLMVLNMLGKNGVRIDVADENNLGKFVSESEGLEAIANLLDEGYEQLNDVNDPELVRLALSKGFADEETDFGTVDNFKLFNRALAARVAAYRKKWDDVLKYLDDSFYDLDRALGFGPRHEFSNAPKDILNGFYRAPLQGGDMFFAHANYGPDGDYFEDAKDLRLGKFYERGVDPKYPPIVNDGLTGVFETRLYAAPDSPIDIIRNEELIFLYAEANLQKENSTEFLKAINRIRTYYGLDEYSGSTDKDTLIEEFLNQKRYSFWGEGHLFVDYRRYGKQNDDYLPIDREGDDVFSEFPRPGTEVD